MNRKDSLEGNEVVGSGSGGFDAEGAVRAWGGEEEDKVTVTSRVQGG